MRNDKGQYIKGFGGGARRCSTTGKFTSDAREQALAKADFREQVAAAALPGDDGWKSLGRCDSIEVCDSEGNVVYYMSNEQPFDFDVIGRDVPPALEEMNRITLDGMVAADERRAALRSFHNERLALPYAVDVSALQDLRAESFLEMNGPSEIDVLEGDDDVLEAPIGLRDEYMEGAQDLRTEPEGELQDVAGVVDGPDVEDLEWIRAAEELERIEDAEFFAALEAQEKADFAALDAELDREVDMEVFEAMFDEACAITERDNAGVEIPDWLLNGNSLGEQAPEPVAAEPEIVYVGRWRPESVDVRPVRAPLERSYPITAWQQSTTDGFVNVAAGVAMVVLIVLVGVVAAVLIK